MQVAIKIKETKCGWQATAPELNIHAFGDTKAKAIVRLKLIVRFYAETANEMGFPQTATGQPDGSGAKNPQPPPPEEIN